MNFLIAWLFVHKMNIYASWISPQLLRHGYVKIYYQYLRQFIKGLHYGLHILKIEPKFSSSSFVIRANFLHLEPFLFLYGLVVSLMFFSVLVNYYFQVSLT